MVTSAKEISDLAHGVDVHSSGNVGIGTSNPASRLHIKASNGGYTGGIQIENSGDSTKGAITLSSSNLYISSNSSNDHMTILANGNVGIGTTNPGAELSVSGPASLANLGGGSTGSAALYVNSTSGHTGELIQVLKNGATKMHMANDGKLGIGTSSPSYKFHAVDDSSNTDPESNLGVYYGFLNSNASVDTGSAILLGSNNNPGSAIYAQRIGANNEHKLGIQVRNSAGSSTTRLTVMGSGNVGIGTTNPDQALQVKGIIETQASNSTNGWMMYTYTDNTLRFNYNGVGGDEIIMNNSGNAGIGTAPYTNARLTIGGTDGGGYPAVLQFDNNNSSGAEFFMLATDTNWSAGSNKFIMGHGAPSSSNADITIDSAGKVGIGTYNPGQKLTVAGGIESTSGQGSVNFYATSAGSYSQQNGTGGTAWAYGSTGGSSAPNTAASSTFGFHHWNGSAWSNPLNIQGDGDVGVGTGAPAAALDVYGNFISRDNASTTHTGASSTQHAVFNRSSVSGKLNLPMQIYFQNGTSNLAVRLYTTVYSLWFSGEVIFGSTYSNAPCMGYRRYSFSHNYNGGTNYNNVLTNTENLGVVSSHFELNHHGYDGTEGAHYFEFRHITSSGNPLYIQFQGHGASPDYDTAAWYYKHTTY